MFNQELIDELTRGGYLKTPPIIDAFSRIDRKDFVVPGMRDVAYMNEPLPIGYGQTISQPLTVAFMLELLSPKSGQKILDIGFGSGWTTALLAHIVGQEGEIYGIEIIPEIFEFGKKNMNKYHHMNIKLFNQSGYEGLKEEKDFDRILVSASADKIPKQLKVQLKIGGKLVIPVRNSIFEIKRKEDDEFEEKEHFGFSFVPFIEN